jgi:CrcB protein
MMRGMTTWFCLAAGGTLGTFARYGLSQAAFKAFGASFPYGTLAVNLIGSFLVGSFAELAGHRMSLGPQARIFLMTGFCGAFTTFSAFMLESSQMIHAGHPIRAFFYVVASVAAGFILFHLGTRFAALTMS